MPKVDTREPKSRSNPLVRAGWELCSLKHGDYEGLDCVEQKWLIEHKLIGQLLQDMKSGQLTRQCQGIIDHSNFPILLIEGRIYKRHEDGVEYVCDSYITWTQFWNQLRSIQDAGCRLEITIGTEHTSTQDTVNRLFAIAEYYAKSKHDSMRRHLSGDPYIEALSLIEGIDTIKARAIKEAFPCLAALIHDCESVQDIEHGVKGIGAVLAKRIWEFFYGV